MILHASGKTAEKSTGYNALTGEFVDMIEGGHFGSHESGSVAHLKTPFLSQRCSHHRSHRGRNSEEKAAPAAPAGMDYY